MRMQVQLTHFNFCFLVLQQLLVTSPLLMVYPRKRRAAGRKKHWTICASCLVEVQEVNTKTCNCNTFNILCCRYRRLLPRIVFSWYVVIWNECDAIGNWQQLSRWHNSLDLVVPVCVHSATVHREKRIICGCQWILWFCYTTLFTSIREAHQDLEIIFCLYWRALLHRNPMSSLCSHFFDT